ncbi:uncharacterized protein SPPG_06353 [Spizellomyces punctatus DAOM BR117]|uniref:F-box domain-containing protein n=1 Tax=Spizellomyces punctatus (strain DAOM BR117) TaxID=645134 RepID=A0A0L0HAT3_SPIPD|nr:uncharacterized protein SPPG_06353 [Spizellomyces punctatus DAOM BR117]KNC98670.1 hypothetical protein SPPG_06353 [Spizellomyces punctatus DAOM BR117]|eukprot:XP_016606710.1 hypothetical protein SPPG_06353 [Spizellomyces punctatus DAOM BR117]
MDLPEIALRVFCYLDSISLVRCERVCRDWSSLLIQNENHLWCAFAAALSPVNGRLPHRLEWETWKDIVRLKHAWDKVLPKLTAESRRLHDPAEYLQEAPTIVGEVVVDTTGHNKDRRSKVSVMDSYSSSETRDYIQTQAVGPHIVYAITGISHIGTFDIRASSISAPSIKLPATSFQHPPRLQRVFHSTLIPVHEGMGWMSFWDPRHTDRQGRFRAIDDEYCQGQLYEHLYACFNPRWSDDESETVDARRIVRLWDVKCPSQPILSWNAQLPGHVVDVALNDSLVACAYGSRLDAEAGPIDNAQDTPVFGLEFRSVVTGDLVRSVPALSGVQDVIFLVMTRFYCLVVRAPDDGQLVTVVDLATGNVAHEINLMESFIRTYGGLHVKDDETMLMLWSSSNRLACLDLIRGCWTLHERKRDELFEKWHYGVWVAIEQNEHVCNRVKVLGTNGTIKSSISDKSRFRVIWKAIGGVPSVSPPSWTSECNIILNG